MVKQRPPLAPPRVWGIGARGRRDGRWRMRGWRGSRRSLPGLAPSPGPVPEANLGENLGQVASTVCFARKVPLLSPKVNVGGRRRSGGHVSCRICVPSPSQRMQHTGPCLPGPDLVDLRLAVGVEREVAGPAGQQLGGGCVHQGYPCGFVDGEAVGPCPGILCGRWIGWAGVFRLGQRGGRSRCCRTDVDNLASRRTRPPSTPPVSRPTRLVQTDLDGPNLAADL
jgi:hypothetical protein